MMDRSTRGDANPLDLARLPQTKEAERSQNQPQWATHRTSAPARPSTALSLRRIIVLRPGQAPGIRQAQGDAALAANTVSSPRALSSMGQPPAGPCRHLIFACMHRAHAGEFFLLASPTSGTVRKKAGARTCMLPRLVRQSHDGGGVWPTGPGWRACCLHSWLACMPMHGDLWTRVVGRKAGKRVVR